MDVNDKLSILNAIDSIRTDIYIGVGLVIFMMAVLAIVIICWKR